MTGYSNGTIPFNHGQLCQMLRSASDEQLDNILLDVCKEQHRRNDVKKELYTTKIRDAIHEAVSAGFYVDFFTDIDNENPDFTIHSNNETLLSIELEREE